MKLDEFIEATGRLETYYSKELSTEQMQIMYEELKNLNIERYRKLISKCLKTCKYMPKVADIIMANNELIGEVTEEEKEEIHSCLKCEGTGYVFYTRFKNNGNVRIPYTFVARCDCQNSSKGNIQVPSINELGIRVGKRKDQVNDILRGIEQINKDLVSK